MKLNNSIFYIVIITSILSCTKNDAELNISITTESNKAYAGQEVVFSIKGDADFITFYNDADSATDYNNYPLAQGIPVDTGTVSYTYYSQGVYNPVFIALSYGDWGEKTLTEEFKFEIEVIDNRTGIKAFSVKTSGLFGQVYSGTIDDEAGTVNVETPPGTKINNLTTTLIPESNAAKIYLDGEEFINKSRVDYSSGSKIFIVEAPDGTKRDWTVTVSN